MSQEDHQIIIKYLFIITPLQIKSNSKVKNNNRKSILIKLGNKTAKCSEINTSLQLEIDVIYSKTLQRYCPIKGIIKIYDVAGDGSEIISCVGGFQTDQLLNEGKKKVTIQKEIGTSKLKMEIDIIKKQQKLDTPDKNSTPKETSVSKISNKHVQHQKITSTPSSIPLVKGSLSNDLPQKTSLTKIRQNPLQNFIPNSSKQIEVPYKNTSSSINKSLEKINRALSIKRFQDSRVSTKANQILAKAELQTLKQQLTDEKRKSSLFEDRYNKINLKFSNYKTNLNFFQTQVKDYIDLFKSLLSQIDFAENKDIYTVLDKDTKLYSFKYLSSDIDRVFKDFISTIIRKTTQPLPTMQFEYQHFDSNRSGHEIEQNRKQLTILKKLMNEKDKKIHSIQKQLEGMQVTNNNLRETNKHLNEENEYLREKNDQIQLNMYHKENIIDSLRKKVENIVVQLQNEQKRHVNSCLIVQQLKEQIANCNETIQKYRQKYGDLKNVKNRAIQMDIKQCLRWIDLQNRDLEMSEIEQTMQTDHEEDRGDSLSSVIRNIQIDKVPIQQMSIIRNQLVKILQKVDLLLQK